MSKVPATSLTVTSDVHDPGRVHFEGDASDVAVRAVHEAACRFVIPWSAPLVLDVSQVTMAAAGFVALVNELARRAEDLRRTVVLEVGDDTANWLTSAALHSKIRVERTSAMPVVSDPPVPRAVRAPAAAGVARREGAGFVTSYGQARRCAALGCATTLSRYNSSSLCGLHKPQMGRLEH